MVGCEQSSFRAALTVDVGPFLFELDTRTVLINEWHPAQASLCITSTPVVCISVYGRNTLFVSYCISEVYRNIYIQR